MRPGIRYRAFGYFGLQLHYSYGLLAFLTILNFEFDRLTLIQRLIAIALNFIVVHEYVSARISGNKTVTFLVTEPFDCAFRHSSSPPLFHEIAANRGYRKSRKARSSLPRGTRSTFLRLLPL